MTTSTVVADGRVRLGEHGEFPCTITITNTMERVRSDSAVKPDAGWDHTDVNGHRHHVAEGTFPTLNRGTVHRLCDGTCGGVCGGEGYEETEYRCRECGVVVEPRFVPDDHARTVGIPVMRITEFEAEFTTRRWLGPQQPDESGVITIRPTDGPIEVADAVLVLNYDGREGTIAMPGTTRVQSTGFSTDNGYTYTAYAEGHTMPNEDAYTLVVPAGT